MCVTPSPLLSNGEHVVTAAEVQAAGGHSAWARIRRAAVDGTLQVPRFAEGGPVFPLRDTGAAMLRVATPAGSGIGTGGDLVGELRALRVDVQSLQSALGRPNVQISNPVSRDAKSDAWEAAQILDA
jgi:hypothetical protein